MHREGLVVLDVDGGDAAVEFGIADRALRVAADLVGKLDVLRGDRNAIGPGRIGANRIGKIDPLLADG
jgi:hypothetical protein